MQNLILPSKPSTTLKPIEETNKNAALNSQLNQNASKSQDNIDEKNSFQSMLNKQVQAKRALENTAAPKAANKPAVKNTDNATQKTKAAEAPNNGEANASEKATADDPSNATVALNKSENTAAEKNLQPNVADKESLVKDEATRKMTEDAAILAALMQDFNDTTPQTMVDPAAFKVNAQLSTVQLSTERGRGVAKTTESLSSNPDKAIEENLLKNITPFSTENKAQQTALSDDLAQQQWKSAMASATQSLEANTEPVPKDQPLAALKALTVETTSPNKPEILSKDLMSQENTPNTSAINALQNSPLNNNIATNPLLATSALGSSNQISAYPGKSGWDQAISQKVMWMLGAGEQSATLTLNPPDLGPVQVVVSVNNNQADTTFISDNADVRQALQDGLEHLREKMEASGIQLGQANINTGQQSQQSQQNFQEAAQKSFSGQAKSPLTSTMIEPTSRLVTRQTNGLVDTFA